MIKKKPRVLFVDDEPLVLEGIRRTFLKTRKSQWELSFETNPQKAITLQKENAFDIVVTDLKMPEIDGILLAQRLNEINPDTQVIMLSGAADMEAALEVINSTKIFKFYIKPCEPEVLEKGITQCLAHAQQKRDDNNDIGFAVLDRLPIGVVVCEGSKVVHLNQFGAEICSERNGLCVDQGGFLRSTHNNVRGSLHDALNEPVKKEDSAIALSIPRSDNLNPLSIIISSVRAGDKAQNLVLISAPEKHIAPSEKNLQSMYDMPLSEAKLLRLIVSGYQLKAAAIVLKITEGSARTYLKRIFSRTNTKGQPELVRKILLTPGVCE